MIFTPSTTSTSSFFLVELTASEAGLGTELEPALNPPAVGGGCGCAKWDGDIEHDELFKGQLISKDIFGVFKSTKKPTKFLQEFLP